MSLWVMQNAHFPITYNQFGKAIHHVFKCWILFPISINKVLMEKKVLLINFSISLFY